MKKEQKQEREIPIIPENHWSKYNEDLETFYANRGLLKKYFICMDVGLTGFFSIIQYEKNKVNKYFKVIHSELLQVELKSDNLLAEKSNVSVKNQISFKKNFKRIKELMELYQINPENCIAMTEQLTPRPFHSRVSILSLGDTNGACRAIMEVLGIKYYVIPPKTWKDGLNVTSEKETSIDYFTKNIILEENVKDMFGILPVGAKQKNGKPKKQKALNHNQVESVLIAYWYYLTKI